MPVGSSRVRLADAVNEAPRECPGDPVQVRAWRSRALTAVIAELSTMGEDGRAEGAPRIEAPAWLVGELDAANIDSLYYRLAGRLDAPQQQIYQLLRDRQRELIARVADELGSCGIAVVIVKGAELVEWLLDGQAVSTQTDVDILVPREQIEQTRAILLGLGYAHGEYDFADEAIAELDADAIAAYEAQHIELYPLCRVVPFKAEIPGVSEANKADLLPFFWSRRGGVFLEALDVHHTLLLGSDAAPLFDRAVPSRFVGAKTLSATDHFWTTAVRFYLEAGPSDDAANIRDLAYLMLLLRRESIDWDLVIDAIEHYDIRPTLFYTLRVLDSLGASISAFVFERLHVHRGSVRLDHGCRATRALGWVEGIHGEIRHFGKPHAFGLEHEKQNKESPFAL